MKLSVQITDRNNKVSVVANGSNYSITVIQVAETRLEIGFGI